MKIILILFLIYLIYSSIWDILIMGTPKIENYVTLAVSAITLIVSAIVGSYPGNIVYFFGSILLITAIIYIPILLKSLGSGDGVAYLSQLLLFAATSFVTGTNNIKLFVYSLIIGNIVFLIYYFFTIKKGHRKVPMFPFITIGYIVSMIYYFKTF